MGTPGKALLLLRHAKSSWRDSALDDFERPLKGRGIKACATMAAYMAGRGIRPDLVLCSPARRARETCGRILEHLGQAPDTRYEAALYLASAERILDEVRKAGGDADTVLVIGHNPGIGALAETLARSGEPRALEAIRASKFPTAALAEFRLTAAGWRDAGPDNLELTAFATPKSLVLSFENE